MRNFKQPVARMPWRAILVAALSTCSFAVWAQTPRSNQVAQTAPGGATAPAKSKVGPPPADLEPGVNTSATQPSSPEPVPAPVAASKPAATTSKRVPPAGSSEAAGAAATQPANSATVSSSTVAAPSAAGGKTAAPKSGAAAGKSHDSLELDTTQITGNRELPKVLYIVPWKRSDLGDLVGKPVNSLLDEVLTPVDRDVFKRQNRYYDALKPDDAKDAAAAAPGSVNEKR